MSDHAPSLIKILCEGIYINMLVALQKAMNSNQSELDRIETAYKIAADSWHELTQKLKDQQFENAEEEIDFFKNDKPRFTCQIEYYKLRNHAALFMPENSDSRQAFWENERGRLERFYDRHKQFVNYYKNNYTDRDVRYFLAKNQDLTEQISIRPYDRERKFISSHDCLIAMMMSEEMYHEFAVARLNECVQSNIGVSGESLDKPA